MHVKLYAFLLTQSNTHTRKKGCVLMQKVIAKKIRREARRQRVSIDDLNIALKYRYLLSIGAYSDAMIYFAEIREPSNDLWLATERVKSFATSAYPNVSIAKLEA